MEYNNPEEKLTQLVAIEQLTRQPGWELFMDYIKKEQAKYLKEARDKRRQFSGDKIAIFMACEGVCDGVANWAQTQLAELAKVREEAKLHRDR